ncbi:PspC domain-containing protein [Portibacter marinus]|uniref:PspC domain-containing protein n=1 Tax=Portibacter marinus TaxID=2898660 RepID=UPI001F35B9A9|nr:PspC domain-containing protein [Portibacter marinus]
MLNFFRVTIERSVFGVCSYLAEKMGIRSARVRVYFIYLTFATLGSTIIPYLVTAFWLNVKKYIRSGRNMLLD